MTTMKVALYDGTSSMTMADFPLPEPGPGDVLVRVRATGICGSDLLMNVDKTAPDTIPFGHEVAGEIAAVGHGVAPSLEIGRAHV